MKNYIIIGLGILVIGSFLFVNNASAKVEIISIDVSAQDEVLTYGTPGTATYLVTFYGEGKGTVNITPLVVPSTPGVTPVPGVFSPTSITLNTNNNYTATTTFTVSTQENTLSDVFYINYIRNKHDVLGAGTLTINHRLLTVSGLTANNKQYDGTTTATLDYSAVSLGGVVAGDDVWIRPDSAYANFDTPDVGAAKTVTVSGLALNGAQASRYIINQPVLTADITP